MPRYENREQLLALEILSSPVDNIFVNKKLLQEYGPKISIFLCNLIREHNEIVKYHGPFENGKGFASTHEKQSKETGLSPYQIKSIKEKARKLGLIDTYMACTYEDEKSNKSSYFQEYYVIQFDRIIFNIMEEI